MRCYPVVVLICISLMISDFEHFFMSIGHLCVLFGEVSIQVLCPFFNWAASLPGFELFFIYFGN